MLDRLQEPPKAQSRPYRSVSSSRDSSSLRDSRTAELARTSEEAESSDEALARKMCVVEFRSGEAVIRHPDLKCFLEAGWLIESAVPQIADTRHVELRVVLSKCDSSRNVSADEDL